MMNSIKNIYNDIEKEYLEFEDKILDSTIDIYKKAEEFFTAENLLLSVNGSDKISFELEKMRKYARQTESLKNEEWTENIKLFGVTLGHFNELLLKKLALEYSIAYNSQSIAKTINNFEGIFTKAVIFDLKSLNIFRNKIVHYNEYSYEKKDLDLNNIDNLSKNIYNSEILAALCKAEKIYCDILKHK